EDSFPQKEDTFPQKEDSFTQAARTVAIETLDWSPVRRVLLVRLRSIGDSVLMTPCLEALKSWRPDLRVAVLSEPLAAPVLEDHPLVSDLLIVGRSVSSRARLITGLRRRRFDIAFNMHGGTTGTILARLSGARRTVGYGDYRLSWMLGERAPSPGDILGRVRMHSVEQQLALLHWSGVPWPAGKPRLSLQISEEAWVLARERLARTGIDLSGNGFAVLAPAAAMESKRWPTEGFAAVADHLSERWSLSAIVIAGPGQEQIAREVSAHSRAKPVVVTGLSLKEVMALIDLAKVFISNDSGPMHIAAALKRPIVAIFGSSNVDVWHPWTDSPYRVVQAEGNEAGEQGSRGAGEQRSRGARVQRSRGEEKQGRGEAPQHGTAVGVPTTPAPQPVCTSTYPIRQIPARDVMAAADEVMEMIAPVSSI
ncbi:MAG: glycosyltransferase family 9 protein, partial [Blastocatellia bacterium]|nr:glycosyltransferase family 9 protein [Blastocatellia bacterium]